MSNWNGRHIRGYGRVVRELKRDEAQQRVKLSPADQLKALDERLGVNIGAFKERARLSGLLDAEA